MKLLWSEYDRYLKVISGENVDNDVLTQSQFHIVSKMYKCIQLFK